MAMMAHARDGSALCAQRHTWLGVPSTAGSGEFVFVANTNSPRFIGSCAAKRRGLRVSRNRPSRARP
jgi:hypothetical protein